MRTKATTSAACKRSSHLFIVFIFIGQTPQLIMMNFYANIAQPYFLLLTGHQHFKTKKSKAV